MNNLKKADIIDNKNNLIIASQYLKKWKNISKKLRKRENKLKKGINQIEKRQLIDSINIMADAELTINLLNYIPVERAYDILHNLRNLDKRRSDLVNEKKNLLKRRIIYLTKYNNDLLREKLVKWLIIANNLINKNTIKGELEVKSNNKNIFLFNTKIKNGIYVFLNNKLINIIRDNNNYIINYAFEKNVKYNFKIIIKGFITNFEGFFEQSSNIISLDLSNFDFSNVTNMRNMFNKCDKLKVIKGINQINTNNVTNMNAMFQGCTEIENLDLSNFDTSNVTDMSFMFNECNKLMFLNLKNFSINGETKNMFRFKTKNKCKFITENKNLLNLYYSFD